MVFRQTNQIYNAKLQRTIFFDLDDEHTIFSSLKVEKEMTRPEIVSTVRDKIVTVFDKRVYHSHEDSLTGKLMCSAEAQVLHAGGTDNTLFLVEGTV